jgi:radical SAM superfamily enzyme YgiQ (UPF0313 family)
MILSRGGALRILLISVNRETIPAPVAPLGISYIAGAARRAGHLVELLDLCFSTDLEGDIACTLRRFSPDLIGVSIRNMDNLTFPGSISYLEEIQSAVAVLKRESQALIVAGGPGFSIFPEALLSRLDLPLGIVGEGEETFCMLARYLEEGKDVPDLPNLLRAGNPAAALRRQYAPFGGNGGPARDLLDNKRYLKMGGMANLQTKRGCPFDCSYCTYPNISGPELRLRPAGDVAEELGDMNRRLGIDHVFIVDDIFNWPHDHAMEICEAITARGLRIAWSCFATPLGMTPELAASMKRAGCMGVEFGTDTASVAMLSALCKPFQIEDLCKASDACRQAGLPDAHYLIFGGPGETLQTLEETFAMFDRIQPRAVLALLGVRIYPGTSLHETAIAEGVVGREDDLLLPRFYISPAVGSEALQNSLAAHAEGRNNWVVPGLGIRSEPALLATLRRMGYRGPLWDML